MQLKTDVIECINACTDIIVWLNVYLFCPVGYYMLQRNVWELCPVIHILYSYMAITVGLFWWEVTKLVLKAMGLFHLWSFDDINWVNYAAYL